MIKLTIEVTNIALVISLYDRIYIDTSTAEAGTYTFIDSIVLVAGVSTYTYDHTAGTSDTWYRSSFFNTSTSARSSYSASVKGTSPTLFTTISYPVEFDFDATEELTIRNIRRLIGDPKGLTRLYIDGTDDLNCTSVSILEDNKTIEMEETGWPVYIAVDGTEFTTLGDPVVQGYMYLTFSGSAFTGSEVIEIWQHTFRLSDRQVHQAYSDAMVPPLVSVDCVTVDHLMLQAAIDLLEGLLMEDSMQDMALIRDDQTMFDPSAGQAALRERGKAIDRLRKQLDRLVKECIKSDMLGLEGVLLD